MDFILRQQPTSDELPPWAGIMFKYPVDSDALSEKLRAAYPDCKTLRERKHRAAIDFLSEELSRMQSQNSIIGLPFTTTSESPAGESRLDGSKIIVEVTPEGSDLLSASGHTSPSVIESLSSPRLAERARKGFRATSDWEPLQPLVSPTSVQQFVWSAHDGRSLRPKTKRKMTMEERSAYKETRKRGACDKCRRQKGRCTHIKDGDSWQTTADAQEPKRRASADYDASQQAVSKSIKVEHASDIHQETSRKQHTERQRAVNGCEISMNPLVGSFSSIRETEERDTEYVQSQNLLGHFAIQPSQDQEPWSTSVTRDSSGPALPGYILDVTHSLSSPQVDQAAGFSFQHGMPFYDDPWIPNQEQQSGVSPPDRRIDSS